MPLVVIVSLLVFGGGAAASQDPMTARGAQAMGFDQNATTHHFLIYEDGGAIDISVKDASDAANRDAIRSLLPHIAQMFGMGQFDLPHFIHATDVPGTAELAKLTDQVRYTYKETPAGGRVDIVTSTPEARAALHAFLRFQITDHKTGDSLEPVRRGGQPR
jgi:hypothetical protein